MIRRVVRALAALVALGALLVGLPIVLVRVAGWPLPGRVPDWGHAAQMLQQGDIPAAPVIKALAVVLWVLWLAILWSTLWELVQVRHRSRPSSAGAGPAPRRDSAPLVPATVSIGVGRLVAAVMAIGLVTAHATTAVAAELPRPAPVAAVSASASRPTAVRTTPSATSATSAAQVASVASTQWVAARGDTLWDIADKALGDGTRVDEIVGLNPRLGQNVRSLRAGQVIQLPADAQIPAARRPVARAAVEQVGTEAEGGTHVVVPGDTMWDIVEDHYGHVDGDLVLEVAAASNIADPSRIVAGDRVVLPDRSRPEAAIPTPTADDTHLVVAGDSYWRIAADDLHWATGEEPSAADVQARTQELIALNAPRLGHDDARLILPGETVVLNEPSAEADSSAEAESVAVVDVAPPQVVVTPVVDTQPAAPLPPPAPSVPVRELPAMPPTPVGVPSAASPRTSAEAHPQVVASATTDGETGISVELVLGSSVLVAGGAMGLLAARRRRRLRAATLDHRLPPAPGVVADTERRLRAVGGAELLARLDLALRVAAPDIAAQNDRIVAVEAQSNGELRLTTDRISTPISGPWQLDVDECTWVLAPRWSLEDLAASARHTAAPCPALAHVGSTDGGQLYVDLEAVGFLAVDLPEPMATDVVRCVAASIALSPLAGATQLVAVGLPTGLFDTATGSIESAESLDAALELAAASLGSVRSMARTGSTFALRSRGLGAEGWEPAVVVAAGHQEHAIDAAREAAGDGLAVVAVGKVDDAEWRLELRDGRVVLAPLEVALTPCGLSVGALTDVHELLHVAETPLELRARVVALPLAADPDASSGGALDDRDVAVAGEDVEPAWSLLVRVFGEVEVVGHDGTVAVFERSKATELVVWLTQHRRRPTRTAARTALWDIGVRDATFANVVSDARRAMARAVNPPDGEEWLARTLTEDLPLHDEVVTDADLIATRMERARGRAPREAVALLRPAVDLLAGMPFAGTSYLWTDTEGLSSSLTLLGVGASLQMARLSLDLGELEDVFWATAQGLRVLSGHEELIALRMQAHAATGDLAAVRHEWASYERAIDADPWAAAAPSPKLVALRHQLLSAGAAAGS